MSSESSSPSLLVARIQRNDSAAKAELVERFGRGLNLMLRRRCRDPAQAEDVFQETLNLVIEKIRSGEVRQPESLAGFIHGIARNLLIAHRRREARYVPAGDAPETLSDLASPRQGGEPAQLRRILQDEEARLVRLVLGELRFERDRELLARYYLSEDSKEEISSDLGIDPERFNRVIHRARERLRELWQRSEKRQRVFRSTW